MRDRTPFTFSKHREVTKINHGNLSCLPSSLSLVRKRKERLPASLPTYIFTFSCFVLLNRKEGLPPVFPRLPAHYYEFLSLLFCCLHSSQKCERCGGHPFHFVSSGEIPNCRRLSLLVSQKIQAGDVTNQAYSGLCSDHLCKRDTGVPHYNPMRRAGPTNPKKGGGSLSLSLFCVHIGNEDRR